MEAQAIAYTANCTSVVFKILIDCLEKKWSPPSGLGSEGIRPPRMSLWMRPVAICW